MFLSFLASGRVVNVSSVLGTFSPFLNAAYSSTKFAAEAFSDALRREMRDFGVKVAVIQPCNFGGATESLNVSTLTECW
jgi:short-subunit dehydrogenase